MPVIVTGHLRSANELMMYVWVHPVSCSIGRVINNTRLHLRLYWKAYAIELVLKVLKGGVSVVDYIHTV